QASPSQRIGAFSHLNASIADADIPCQSPESTFMACARCLCRLLQVRNRESERCALIDLRSHGDVAAVQSNDFAGQRQTKARTGNVGDALILGAIELFENQFALLFIDADAGVADFDGKLMLVGFDSDGDG